MEAEQVGSREGRSTMTNLYKLIFDLKAKIVSRDLCEATFYNLEKAFGSVNHDLLLYCLLKLGLLGINIALIYSFVENRSAG